jgi:hypothetical protein
MVSSEDSREVTLQAAISDLNNGVFTSIRACAKAYHVPRSTLSDRLAHRPTRSMARQQQQRLSPEQEEFIAAWILMEDSAGCPPSHARVRDMATRILQMGGDATPLGKKWITHFIQRNPRIASRVGRTIDRARSAAANQEDIKAFFELYDTTCKELGITPENTWNMDETGVAQGACDNSRVLTDAKKRKTYCQSSGDREWVSIVEVVSAVGVALKPVVILRGKALHTTWFPSIVPDWLYTYSERGWTSNAIGLEWLKQVFIPQACQPGRWTLLIMDGHGSHISAEFIMLCKENNLQVLYLPAHASHLLQPLDLNPFSVLKNRYRQELRELSALDDAAPIKKDRFIQLYEKARGHGLSPYSIQAGWRASGMVPFNPRKVLGSSQVRQPPSTPTKPKPIYQLYPLSDYLPATPTRAQDIRQAQKQLQQSESITRNVRGILASAAKGLEQANTRAAEYSARIARLQYQLSQAQKPSKRKKIKQGPNERFASMNKVVAAMELAKAEAAKTTQKRPKKAAATPAINADQADLASYCSVFQS